MTDQNRGFPAAMLAAETIADLTLLVDFCLLASTLALVAPLSAAVIVSDAGRRFIGSMGRRARALQE